ncbi:MAG: hypothetical protein AAF471_04545 [Myxococcota bacterium]
MLFWQVMGEGNMHAWKFNEAATHLEQLMPGVERGIERENDQSLVDFLLNSPLAGAELHIERDPSPARDIKL